MITWKTKEEMIKKIEQDTLNFLSHEMIKWFEKFTLKKEKILKIYMDYIKKELDEKKYILQNTNNLLKVTLDLNVYWENVHKFIPESQEKGSIKIDEIKRNK